MNEYGEISEDLHYLQETLRDFRQNNRDNSNLNELIYLYSSFKVIKKTVQSLSFDYIPYEQKDIAVFNVDENLT